MTREQDASSPVERYRVVRSQSGALCETLESEDYVVQSMPDVSPTRWHLAHTSWFFETFLLVPHLPGYRVCHPAYAYLFNSYYNQIGQQFPRPRRGLLSRPTVREVFAYRRHVDDGMERLLEQASAEPLARVLPLVEIGLHHEQQHQELMLTDIKHVFSVNPLGPVFRPEERPSRNGPPTPSEAPDLRWIEIDGGIHQVGHAGEGFAFDNETPRHEALIRPLRLASRPVTNGEYLEFVEDGGYRRPEVWLSDGWDVVRAEAWEAPLYWSRDTSRDDGSWLEFTLSGRRELRAEEPVCHVSYYEADAYARWADARLPTEEEWEVAAERVPAEGHLADAGRFHPRAARGAATGAANGADEPLQQMIGDVWEWTSSPYVSYPGFRAPEGALGEYNAKFMSGRFVLRGGSCVTAAGHIRRTYRNFFAPGDRWQFQGIRLARDVEETSS